MAERHFTERQVADIIRRAAEHHTLRGRSGSPVSQGISESEVRRIAQELGIDLTALQDAIQEVGVWDSSDSGTLQSVGRTLERVFGAALPDDSYVALLEEFVPTYGPMTQAPKIGSTLNYTSMVGMAQCNVNVSQRNGRTSLRVKSNAGLAALPTLLLALLLTCVSGALVWDEMTATTAVKALIHVLFTVGVWTAAVVGFRAMVRNTNRKVVELLDRSSGKLAESVVCSANAFEGRAALPLESATEGEARIEQNL